ncbi:contractile injection system protein, VgrG/Pvc8 family [Brevibacillus ruminantium]|uniref:Contractile injection system protein, VgrG/Pvc8 family n=1 Tax=Brevibacillus ruminantium TaxID=2950604 RepID=A0ABY4WK08_9BACL|nr:contractile injection system protein, VgrG/Pvc8 family [Brevibacillus ruminantium]USG67452.1 contractile injection system protein, VgrG/Pvc8 family [Brevibacillus ruminantium]
MLQVWYENKEISADLRPHVLGWTYTDNLSGQADDLQITLEDKHQLWSGSWMPDTGAALQASILCENWNETGKTERLPLGSFEIDEVEFEFPPATVTVKAISVPETSSLRGEKKNQAWEQTKLSVIARDKASGAGLSLLFEAETDPELDRVEQTEETDLVFLMRLCSEAGYCLKVTGTQMAIFEEEKYERLPPIATISKGQSRLTSFRASTTTSGVYQACRVEYYSAKEKKNFSYTFAPANAPKTGRTLRVNERVASLGEAQRLAKQKLRESNKEAMTLSLTMAGDTRFVAGCTVMVAGFGFFDGKYIITQATHSQGSGYETSLELRRCLEGYA